MKRYLLLLLPFLILACTRHREEERALGYVTTARQHVEAGMLHQALIDLDSVHLLYPRLVSVRRDAKSLQDSIVYLQAQRNLRYSDSLLSTLTPQVEPLLKSFRYEKEEKYEDAGRYVHRLLQTENNTTRCYLQAYVNDQRITILKSYYAGSRAVNLRSFALISGDDEHYFEGSSHRFESEGWHAILTLEDARALEALNCISSHLSDRVRVQLFADDATRPVAEYYLTDNEKKALNDTYLLGTLFSDIHLLDEQIRISNAQINKYEQKHTQNRPDMLDNI